ncbi:MAG TPA: agmatinase [Casimicrobiaceae bacterium]
MNRKIDIPANYVTGVLGAAGGYDEGHLIATDDYRRICGIATFLKAPLLNDVANPTVGIVGIPFDGGSSRTAGARFGPRGVRDISFRVSGYNAELDVRPHEMHSIVDCGDILVSPFSITDTYRSIERALKSLLDKGIIPVSVGGDHSVTLPLLRAMYARHGPLAVVHFDAHCDVSDTQFGSPYHYGSVFRRAVEEKLIAPGKMVQIGIRKHYHKGELDFGRANGFEHITSRDLKAMGADIRSKLAARLTRLKGHKVYVTFDIDFVDGATAPGVGSPEPFGPNSFEAVEALRAATVIADGIVGLDLVEVSPLHDVSHMTTYLAAQLVFEMVSIIPATRQL